MLDADLVVFCPDYLDFAATESFEGRPCFGKSISFTVRDVHAHWKHQLQLAVQAGRVIIVLLPEIDEVSLIRASRNFREREENHKDSNMVERVSNLDMLPFPFAEIKNSRGKRIIPEKNLKPLEKYYGLMKTTRVLRSF